MCTPENLRMNCSCPHLVVRDLRRVARAVAMAVAVAGAWWLLVSVPWWMLAVGAWVTLMCVAALVSWGRLSRPAAVPAARAAWVQQQEARQLRRSVSVMGGEAKR